MLSSFALGQIYATYYFPIQWFVNVSVNLHKSTFPMPGQSRPKGKYQVLFCPFRSQYRDKNNVVFCNLEEAKHIEWMGHKGGGRLKILREFLGFWSERPEFSPRE